MSKVSSISLEQPLSGQEITSKNGIVPKKASSFMDFLNAMSQGKAKISEKESLKIGLCSLGFFSAISLLGKKMHLEKLGAFGCLIAIVGLTSGLVGSLLVGIGLAGDRKNLRHLVMDISYKNPYAEDSLAYIADKNDKHIKNNTAEQIDKNRDYENLGLTLSKN